MTNGSTSNGTDPGSNDRTAGEGTADGNAVNTGAAARSAACGGPAVHGDWNLAGNGRAVEDYVNQAREFLEHSRIYLADGHLHQASEKGWGAAAHMAKAVALTQGWVYETHADFSVVMNNAYELLGDDSVRPLRSVANELHGNFYQRKRFLNAQVIGADLDSVQELLGALTPLTTPA